MNLQKTAEYAHEIAKSKGFWDIKPSFNTQLMLIISELAEAVEADRKQYYARLAEFSRRKSEVISTFNPNMPPDLMQIYFKEIETDLFKRLVKDSFEDEIADAIIRTMDLMCGFGITIRESVPNMQGAINSLHGIESTTESLLYITTVITDVYKTMLTGSIEDVESGLNVVLHLLIAYCECKDINYVAHINAKLTYNSKRERLHGKKY